MYKDGLQQPWVVQDAVSSALSPTKSTFLVVRWLKASHFARSTGSLEVVFVVASKMATRRAPAAQGDDFLFTSCRTFRIRFLTLFWMTDTVARLRLNRPYAIPDACIAGDAELMESTPHHDLTTRRSARRESGVRYAAVKLQATSCSWTLILAKLVVARKTGRIHLSHNVWKRVL